MSYEAESADQVVRMTLNGIETAARIAGDGALTVARLIYRVISDSSMSGTARDDLIKMLGSGREMKVFEIEDADRGKFSDGAKKYGINYCVLKDESVSDGVTAILVMKEDSLRTSRLIKRFGVRLAEKSGASEHAGAFRDIADEFSREIRSDVEKASAEKSPVIPLDAAQVPPDSGARTSVRDMMKTLEQAEKEISSGRRRSISHKTPPSRTAALP